MVLPQLVKTGHKQRHEAEVMVVNAILSVNNMVAKIKHIFKTYVGSDNMVYQRHSVQLHAGNRIGLMVNYNKIELFSSCNKLNPTRNRVGSGYLRSN